MEKIPVLMLYYICVITFVVLKKGTTEVIYMEAKALFRGPYFSFANFGLHKYSRLEVDGAALKYAQSAEACSKGCAGNTFCFSFNFGTQPIFNIGGVSQYLCELLPTDKYNSPSTFHSGSSSDSHHYSIKTECSRNPCPRNAICVPKYFNDTFFCKDNIDECATKTHKCNSSAYCNNTIGSYNCTCLSGFRGNGFNCVDFNECKYARHNKCPSGAECLNNIGSFSCRCRSGFTGDGKTECDDINECIVTPNICPAFSVCENTIGSVNCKCNPGFTKDNFSKCIDIDECAHNVCHSDANCSNTVGSYLCKCKPHFVGDGKTCSRTFRIEITSDVDEATFIVDGKRFEGPHHGINMMYLNANPPHDAPKNFDLLHGGTTDEVNKYIDDIPADKVVLLAVYNKGENHFPTATQFKVIKFNLIGSKKTYNDIAGIKTWVLLGYKGEGKSWIFEKMSKLNSLSSQSISITV